MGLSSWPHAHPLPSKDSSFAARDSFFVLLPRTRAPLLHVGGEQGEEGEEGEQGEQGEQGEEGEQRERREQQEAREQREANKRRAASAAHARVQQTVHYHLNAALSEIETAFQACR